MIWRAALLAFALAGAAPLAAATAVEAFAVGKFAEAATAGRKEGTDAALILAARAASTQAGWQTTDKARAQALLDAARADLETVLKRSPGNLDALFQRGLITGYIAKLNRSPGLAKQARRDFEAVLAKRPDDSLALAAMGGWHGEAVATLGRFLAGTALGAKEAEAIRYFEKAAAGPAGDPAVPVFYATTLLHLSAGNAARAEALLARAARAPARDGFDRLLQQNARALLVPLARGDVKAARTLAAKLGPLGALR
ncbi:hypothetical protein L6Q21_16960 [Sandaracinobacter sp. RS1-74]|uniref:hypothetical protein n=1 Tax=Sandaracinobacteroides sayramensis TaxID=2913411 RepID=UPI001ED9D678|nr:hypothetical protein [Sandaracinobacteroides sayramensis]MCG2842667.1 hypothetical protein [Sandaracinobacteroides sayramensis]